MTTPHALIVDDDGDIRIECQDRLESLGHSCDTASCMAEARECLGATRFDYVLLDLEIPTNYGKASRKINGQQMLKEICESPKHRLTPVVVITGHGLDSWELATDVMRDGARDFVAKPFANAGERTLERRILAALESPPPVAAATPAGCETMCPFEYGDLDFYPSRVELCGVPVVTGTPIMRAVLEILSKRGANDEYVRRSGAQLASESGCAGGESGVGSAIRSFRSTAERKLREVNLLCDAKVDILVNDRIYGYYLSDKIMVRFAKDPDAAPVATGRDVADTEPRIVADTDDREAWIVESLEAGRSISTRIIQDKFSCSPRTAKRILNRLVDQCSIRFDGAPRTGEWKLVGNATV